MNTEVQSLDIPWHMKKEVTLGTIVVILLAIVSGITWVDSLRNDLELTKQRLALYTVQTTAMQKRQELTSAKILESLHGVRRDLNKFMIEQAKERK